MSDLPKRTPDLTIQMAGAFQGLMNEFLSFTNNILPHVENQDVREKASQYVTKIYKEGVSYLKEVGEKMEENHG